MQAWRTRIKGVAQSLFIAVAFLACAMSMDAIRRPHVEHDRDAAELAAIERQEEHYANRRTQIATFLDATADAETRRLYESEIVYKKKDYMPVATQHETDRYRAAFAAEYVELQRHSLALTIRKDELERKAATRSFSDLFHVLDLFATPGTQAHRIYDVASAGAALVGFLALASAVVLCFGAAFGMTPETIKEALAKWLPANVSSALLVATVAGTTAAVAVGATASSLDWTPAAAGAFMAPAQAAESATPPAIRQAVPSNGVQTGSGDSSTSSQPFSAQSFVNNYFDTTKYFTDEATESSTSRGLAAVANAINALAASEMTARASDAPVIRVLQQALQADLRQVQASVTARLESIEKASQEQSVARSKELSALVTATLGLDQKLAEIVSTTADTVKGQQSIASATRAIADASRGLVKLSNDLITESRCQNKRLEQLSERNVVVRVRDTVRGARIDCP